MFIKFDAEKAVQAAGVLLRAHEGRQMEFLRLLKLLYIADRESLKATGSPIIGNKPVAMDYGPLHSAVYDLIKGMHPDEQIWSAHIQKFGYSIRLLDDPGVLKLSRFEIEILNKIADQYCNDSEWDIVKYTHSFEEWKKNFVEGTSRPIPIEDILDAVGFDESEKLAIIQDLKESQLDDELVAASST